MVELIQSITLELQDISLAVVCVAVVGFLLITFASRLIFRKSKPNQQSKVIWILDVLLLPSLLLALNATVSHLVGNDRVMLIRNVHLITSTVLWLLGAWLLDRGLRLFFWNNVFERIIDAPCPRLISGLGTFGAYVGAIFGIIAFVFERPLTGLLISGGVVAGVAGLALQNLLGDIFSGLAITIERPYKVGDWIEFSSGQMGKVVDVTWQSTHLLSPNNSIIVVPNHIASDAIIHNYSRPSESYIMWYTVSVDSAVSPSLVKQSLLEAAITCERVADDPAPEVYVDDISSQPIKYLLYIGFENFPGRWFGKSDLFISVYKALDKIGISPAAVKYEIATRDAPQVDVQEPTVVENLRSIEIFNHLSNEDIQIIAQHCQHKSYHSGDTLIAEGESGDSLFALLSGVVTIVKDGPSGESIELARMGSGACLGEMALLTGEVRSASVVAYTDCSALEVTKTAIETVLQTKPELADQFADVMARRLANQDAKFKEASVQAKGDLLSEYAREVVTKIKSFFRLKEKD